MDSPILFDRVCVLQERLQISDFSNAAPHVTWALVMSCWLGFYILRPRFTVRARPSSRRVFLSSHKTSPKFRVLSCSLYKPTPPLLPPPIFSFSSPLIHQIHPKEMATAQLTASSISARSLASFQGLRPSNGKFGSPAAVSLVSHRSSFRGLVVKAATTVAPKYTSIKPLGDRVLVKIHTVEEKTGGGILLPTTAQTKPQGGEVVAVGEGKTIGKTKVGISVQTGAEVVYSKYAGTEVEFNGTKHLILKDDDIVGILETDDVKDLKPLNDRVLIKVAEAEQKTAGGLLLTEASKEKPSIGEVIAVGPGTLDEEGNKKPLSISPGSTVLYSKYAGNDFKGKDGSEYIALRASDVIAILS